MESNKSTKYQLRSRSGKSKETCNSCNCCSESSKHPRSLALYVKAREKRKVKFSAKDFGKGFDDTDQPLEEAAVTEDIIIGTPREKRKLKFSAKDFGKVFDDTDQPLEEAAMTEDIIIGTPSPVIRSKTSKKRKIISFPYSRTVVGDNEASASIITSQKSKRKPNVDADITIVSESPTGQDPASFFSSVSENGDVEVDFSDDSDDHSFVFGMSTVKSLGKHPTKKANFKNHGHTKEDVGIIPVPARRKKKISPSSSFSTAGKPLQGRLTLKPPQPGWSFFNGRAASRASRLNKSRDECDGPAGEQTTTRRSTLQFSPDLSFDRFRQALLPRLATSTVASASLSNSMNMEISHQNRSSASTAAISPSNTSLGDISISPPNTSLGDISISPPNRSLDEISISPPNRSLDNMSIPPLTRSRRRVFPFYSSTPAASAHAINPVELEGVVRHSSPPNMDTDEEVICLDLTDTNMSALFSSPSVTEVSPSPTNPRQRVPINPVLFNLPQSESPQVLQTSTVSPATMRNIERIDQISADEALARELQEQFNQQIPSESPGMAAAATATTPASSTVPLPNDYVEDEISAAAWPVGSPQNMRMRSENRRQRVRNLVAQSQQILTQMNERIGQMNNSLQFIEQNSTRRRVLSPPGRGRRRSRSRQPSTELRSELENLDRQLQTLIQSRQQRPSVVLRSQSRGRGGRTRIRFQHTFDDLFGASNYEELLLLEEQMGPAVARGLSKTQLHQLPTFAFTHDNTKEDNTCNICFVDYQESEMLRRLPCFHRYHTECIDPWLKQNRTCPICRVEVKV
ncbi:uncharacterized protein LOC102810036 [Saccoglossus kowalevskii]|uniref:GPI-anchored protein PB15E9.01c-like n=1 Tax=Saccoglossus kowalevskii TaxID=10224 RepID=A0ABM0LXY9_SACKO|nr:PREDICTED: putative GPI-anchored protein PB15E9.01c-like [Saccoglossus kowalevskii]